MFKKWGEKNEESSQGSHRIENQIEGVTSKKVITPQNKNNETNTLLKGSKLIGDIIVTCDLELSGEIEGNITSEIDSNIIIRGTCKGSIETMEGSVEIIGELRSGNISAGKNVKITGQFNGGEITAKGKILIDGEFNGRLMGNEIEIGPNAKGKGELLYREYISIAQGAEIEGQVNKAPNEFKLIKTGIVNNTETATTGEEISKVN